MEKEILAPKIILLAEDDYTCRTLVSEFIQDLGFHVRVQTAQTKSEVLEQAQKADLWIFDIMLGNDRLAGVQVVRQLAEIGVYPKNQIIFVSNFGHYGILASELAFLDKHGISYHWMDKPIGFYSLRSLLETILVG